MAASNFRVYQFVLEKPLREMSVYQDSQKITDKAAS